MTAHYAHRLRRMLRALLNKQDEITRANLQELVDVYDDTSAEEWQKDDHPHAVRAGARGRGTGSFMLQTGGARTVNITLILPYYDNPAMLREQYASVRDLPSSYRDRINMIVVDDGSPMHPAKAEDLQGSALQVYRIDKDVRWNQDAARNIGVHHCETEWMVLTDIDHLVPEATWAGLLNGKFTRDHVYKFARVSAPAMTTYKPHPNSWFMSRKVWNKVGGYDERFAGYYGTDGDFRDRVAELAEIRMLKQALVRVPRTLIPDASTTTYLRKQPEDRDGLDRVKAARTKQKHWTPLTLSFPYHRVYP